MSAKPMARMNDQVAHGSSTCSEVADASSKTKCEGQWVACKGDDNPHGNAKVKTGASKVLEGGKPVARIGEQSSCNGKMNSGASKTIVAARLPRAVNCSVL